MSCCVAAVKHNVVSYILNCKMYVVAGNGIQLRLNMSIRRRVGMDEGEVLIRAIRSRVVFADHFRVHAREAILYEVRNAYQAKCEHR
jgi:hypothetical protein